MTDDKSKLGYVMGGGSTESARIGDDTWTITASLGMPSTPEEKAKCEKEWAIFKSKQGPEAIESILHSGNGQLKVKDLISLLERCDQDAVVISSDIDSRETKDVTVEYYEGMYCEEYISSKTRTYRSSDPVNENPDFTVTRFNAVRIDGIWDI